MTPRLEPLPPDEWDELVRSLATRSPEGDEKALNIFTTIDRHPDLFRRWLALGGALLDGKLEARRRELVILRTAHLISSDYERAQHEPIASALGIGPEEIRSLRAPLDSHDWPEPDLAVLQATDELHERYSLSDATWEKLCRHLDGATLIELVMLVGYYHLVGLLISALQIQIEKP